MQLNVIRGERATGKTTRLRQIAKEDGQSESHIIVGRDCSAAVLERQVRYRVSRGAKVVCIDECSEHQIARLTELKGRLPADLHIYAVLAPMGDAW